MSAETIRMIHIAKQALGMSEDAYRALLARIGNGATSSKQLTDSQLQAVMLHMRACGFKPVRRAADRDPGHTHEQLQRMRAMWWSLADLGAVTRPANAAACDAALEAWAKRQMATHDSAPEALRFMQRQHLQGLIEQLKKWERRVERQRKAERKA